MLLSVVIPTFQQAHRLRQTIAGTRALENVLPYPIEILVVDAGSTDGTPELCEEAGLRVLRIEGGIGCAIRTGMLSAVGVYRLLIDDAWSVPPEQLQMLLPPVQTGFDITLASRYIPGSVRLNEPLASYAMGRMFNRCVQAIVLPGLSDTQLGFKCFRAEAARALFSRTCEDNASIHVEVLALAQMFGLNIVEVPIDWTFQPLQRVSTLLDGPALMAALIRIRTRLSTGRYAPLQVGRPESSDPPGWML
ncbi:MAG: glycosyltransferase [Myxococcota bacterium]|nr:glycosyltransferase [Myxococcota bacterium]